MDNDNASLFTNGTANTAQTTDTGTTTTQPTSPPKPSSKLSKLNPFKKSAPNDDRSRLVTHIEAQAAAAQRDKELTMRYRGMTEAEYEKYLEDKRTGADEKRANKPLKLLGMLPGHGRSYG